MTFVHVNKSIMQNVDVFNQGDAVTKTCAEFI